MSCKVMNISMFNLESNFPLFLNLILGVSNKFEKTITVL